MELLYRGGNDSTRHNRILNFNPIDYLVCSGTSVDFLRLPHSKTAINIALVYSPELDARHHTVISEERHQDVDTSFIKEIISSS